LLTTRLVVPRARLETAFDVDLVALLQVFSCDFGEALPEDDGVPSGRFLPFTAGLVLVGTGGGDGNLRDGRALRRVLYFRVLAQVSYQNNFVYALRHSLSSFECTANLS